MQVDLLVVANKSMSTLLRYYKFLCLHKYVCNITLDINKSDLLFHVVKHEIMEKLINKWICFCEDFPNHHILDKLDSHE